MNNLTAAAAATLELRTSQANQVKGIGGSITHKGPGPGSEKKAQKEY